METVKDEHHGVALRFVVATRHMQFVWERLTAGAVERSILESTHQRILAGTAIGVVPGEIDPAIRDGAEIIIAWSAANRVRIFCEPGNRIILPGMARPSAINNRPLPYRPARS
jgi:hypothetical protein